MNLQAKLDAIKQDPNNVELWIELAKYLSKNGQTEQARLSYERALQIDPTREELYEELWKLETHNALPAWFNALDQSATKSKSNQKAVKAKSRVSPQQTKTNSKPLFFVAILFCFLIAAVGLGFVLLYVSASRAVEFEATSVVVLEEVVDLPGQTTEDAVAIGDALLLKKGFNLTVQKPFLEASEQFDIRYYYQGEGDEEKEWYDEPPPNMRPYVIRMMVENVASEDDYFHLSGDIALHDEQLITYDHDCGTVPEEINSPNLLLGERTEGNLCILVPKEAQIEYLIYDSYEERRYFQLLTR